MALGFSGIRADEGMWLPMLVQRLNYVDMQKMGLRLTAEEIYSINNSSLKDAIVQFGGGCTGEIISSEGLLLTNHHCGYPQIQSHSTVERDILTNGFWAYSKEEEIPCPGLTVKFLIKVEDVTGIVLGEINGLGETDAAAKVREVANKLTASATEGTNYVADVKSFYQGNEYYLFIYEIYNDVRLVGAPPSAIGKFGADADNWMWPRHTGDFSLFRVYSGKDGKPAVYDKENIPLQPKYFLPVSIAGMKEGDFTMIMGYPGRTERFLTSYGIENKLVNEYPNFIGIRQEKLNVMDEFMSADPAVRIKYASKKASCANYWKNRIGQAKQLKQNHVVESKQEIEKQFQSWANDKAEYKDVLPTIEAEYKALSKYDLVLLYSTEGMLNPNAVEILRFAGKYSSIQEDIQSKTVDMDAIKKRAEKSKGAAELFFKDYYKPLDMKMAAKMFELYYNNVPKDQQPEEFLNWVKKNNNDFTKMSKEMFSKTIFADKEKVMAFIDNPTKKAIADDAVIYWFQIFLKNYNKYADLSRSDRQKLNVAQRQFVKGLKEMYNDKSIAPDANSTMRLTYGKVGGYSPADAVEFDYYTTMKGIMQKEDPNNPDFIVPAKLKQLYETKDFGPYGEDGQMNVCFLSNNDITGGNSGSPVLNAAGELIGLAFDGNWEAMSGDIFFEQKMQKTISVDIRYVLFIIDKYADAKNLIQEMVIKTE